MKQLFSITCLFLLTAHAALFSACSHFGFHSDVSAPQQLRVLSETNTFAPGQAVALTLQLRNESNQTLQSVPLNASSVSFLLRPAGPEGQKAIREILPVLSTKEQPNPQETQQIEPGDFSQRTFLFTQLTVERGDFVLLAIYEPVENSKLHAEPFAFSVQGDRVLVHRYLNGLVTRDDAIRLAARKLQLSSENADAMLIQDEMGFLKWHINLPASSSDGQPVTRSCFVDPYWGRVWREAQPFVRTPESHEIPYPEDSRLFQQLQDQVRNPVKRVPQEAQPTPSAQPSVPLPGSAPVAAPSGEGTVPSPQ
jgi:hypothetical protein